MFDFPIYLEVRIGKTVAKPAPLKLMKRLVSAEVQQGDKAPSGFQLVFESPLELLAQDYALMDEPLIAHFNRVALVAWVLFRPTVLIEGYITQIDMDPSSGNLTVTGEDVSAKMDLFELVDEYPKQKDHQIVGTILSYYRRLMISPKVEQPKSIPPVDDTPTQRWTDRQQVQRLAEKNGVLFYITPPAFPGGMSTAYWGPKVLTGKKQRPISAVSGTLKGHVDSFNVSYDALAPLLTYGEKMTDGGSAKESKEARYGAEKSTEKAQAKQKPPLGQFASLIADPKKSRAKASTLRVRGQFIKQAGLDSSTADKTADTETNRSTGETVTVTGTLDTVDYGAVLKAPGLVGLRAAGDSFSGDYYVQQVKHSFQLKRSEMKYTQSFTLTREGLGAKSSVVK